MAKLKNIPQQWFTAFALIALVLWYFIQTAGQLESTRPILNLDTANIHIRDLRVKTFNHEGILSASLYSPLMEHMPISDSYFLEKPKLRILNAHQAPWQIQANYAKVQNDKNEINFYQSIQIHQDQDENKYETHITTESLQYFLKENRASTTEAIVFRQPGRWIQSTGMIGNFKSNEIKLLKETQGFYSPEHLKIEEKKPQLDA